MKTALEMGGWKVTEVSALQSAKTWEPTCVNVCGRVMEVSAVQELKTREPRCVNVSGSLMEVIAVQQVKQLSLIHISEPTRPY